MEQKIKDYQAKIVRFASQLRDVKFAGLMAFVVVVLLVSWSGVKAIQSNYDLQKQIAGIQQQNQLSKLANTNLQLENQYYNTDTYLDLSARQNFGLAAPGEKEILVPKDAALRYTVDPPKPTTTADTPTTKQPKSQRNFEAWVNFFLHRQTTSAS
jgi:cell division protein FtsB